MATKRAWYPAKVPLIEADTGLISREWDQFLRTFAQFTEEAPTGTIDGANTIFTLSEAPNPVTSLVVRGHTAGGTSWTDFVISSTSGKSVTLAVAPAAGSTLQARYRTLTLAPAK